MILSIHQPAYNFWLGYLDKINKSDVFVFLDSVQYEKNSFINRNLMKGVATNPFWLTIPVKTRGYKELKLIDMQIDGTGWRRKHLHSIALNYKKSKNYESIFPLLENIINYETDLLADFCFNQLLLILKELKIEKKLIRSSEMEISSKKSDLVLDICTTLQAEEYISGVNGKNYLEIDTFTAKNINITFQEFVHPNYNFVGDRFVPNLGIFDYLLNRDY